MARETEMRLVNFLIDHPDAHARKRGERAQVFALVDRGLKSGKLDRIPVSERELLGLVQGAVAHLVTLRRDRGDL